MAAGQSLKLLRKRLNITVRDVQQASRRIAAAKGDKRYRLSNGWLVQLENRASPRAVTVRQMFVGRPELDLCPRCRFAASVRNTRVRDGLVLRCSGLPGSRRSRDQDYQDRDPERAKTSHRQTPAKCRTLATSSSGRNGLVT